MQIIGIGVDIIEVERIQKAIERWGPRFVEYVFCPEEIAYAESHKFPAQHFAGRFAAKEAILKAIGNNSHVHWKDMLIMNDSQGKPSCVYKDQNFKHNIFISISHTENYAVANAIITSGSKSA